MAQAERGIIDVRDDVQITVAFPKVGVKKLAAGLRGWKRCRPAFMAQDQQFKDLLQAFFGEFLELFYPDVAARLDLARVTFLDKETFTDVPEGSRREADLVAHVFTQSGEPELILVHVEVQTQRRLDFTYRMWEYYALLRFRHRLPVFPIVVYLAPGTGGVTEETYEEALFGRTLLTFRYQGRRAAGFALGRLCGARQPAGRGAQRADAARPNRARAAQGAQPAANGTKRPGRGTAGAAALPD
jgi:hypothetical protein